MTSAWISRAIACICVSAFAVSASAQQPWKVKGKLVGETKGPVEFKKSKDVSGIACDSSTSLPRLCLVIDDETQGAQIVLLHDDELRAGGFIPLTAAQFAGEPLELDAEGVAFDAGQFYVIGSHGRPRHGDDAASEAKKEAKNGAKAAASRQIFRIALPASAVDMKTGALVGKAEVRPSTALAAVLRDQPDLKPFYDQPLHKNGVTIEGLAVRDRRLFIGMRGPVLDADAVVLSVAEPAAFDGQAAEPTLHRVTLGKDRSDQPRGVRDLVRYRDNFLVLAGPVNDPPEDVAIRNGDYAIYLWDGKSKTADRLFDIKAFGDKKKPEALLPLDGDAEQVRLLLMFDGPDEGAPTSFSIKLK